MLPYMENFDKRLSKVELEIAEMKARVVALQ